MFYIHQATYKEVHIAQKTLASIEIIKKLEMKEKTMNLFVFGFVIILVVSAKAVGGITCSDALAKLVPCQDFLVGHNSSPAAPCCSAIETVIKEADTKIARQELCKCFKRAAPSIGIKPDKAKILPTLCHIHSIIPIDPSVDCSKISF